MILSDLSVRRPVFATVLSLLLVILGLASFASLPVRQYPDIDPPVVTIETRYGGASAEVVETKITQVIEDRTISAPFRASATCSLTDSWEADVIGQRSERFKVGPASLTVRANEAVDPIPDDTASRTVDVDLVRPAR